MRWAFVSVIGTICFLAILSPVLSSSGDRSQIYMECLKNCMNSNCTEDGLTFKPISQYEQDFWCIVLRWSCWEECCYQCMWRTVKRFRHIREETPKFHGRWPFKRFMGMQEPASTFASILNFAANMYMYNKIRKEFPMSKAYMLPLIPFWHAFAMICMNAWMWSTIFHMRDSPFTEFMDYACALSMVMALFAASIVRASHKWPKLTMFLMLIPSFYFVTHVRYLYAGVINYDYNMKLNIFFGTIASVIWLVISCNQHRLGRRYAWRMVAFTLLSAAALIFELDDFPPRFGSWDAHAMWHFSTAPLPLLFYGYVLRDLRYLQSKEIEKSAIKLT